MNRIARNFTDEELLLMGSKRVPNKLWGEAFEVYNSDPKNRKLSMGCKSCFLKVLVYLKSEQKIR